MTKLTSIFVTVISLGFILMSNANISSPEIDIIFSNQAVAIESGQPVFSKGTRIWISNPQKKELKLYINEKKQQVSKKKIDISKVINMKKGTYTVIVNYQNKEKKFGFTIH